MTPEQENIIKDKLLEFEMPFEEKYWEDFQQRQKKSKGFYSKSNLKLYKRASMLVLLLIFSFGIGIGISNYINPNQESTFGENLLPNQSDENQNHVVRGFIENQTTDHKNSINQYNDIDNTSNHFEQNNRKQKSNKGKNLKTQDLNQSKTKHILTTESAIKKFDKREESNINSIYNHNNRNILSNVSFTNSENLALDQSISNKNPINTPSTLPILNKKNVKEISVGKHIQQEEKAYRSNSVVLLDGLDEFRKNNSTINAEELQNKDDIDWSKLKTNNWEVGLMFGIGLNIPTVYSDITRELNPNFNRRPNLMGGAYFKYQLNKRTNIETGFYYKSIDDNFSVRYKLTDNINLVEIDEATIVNRLRSFEIPIGVNFRVSSWLYLSSGLTFAYVKPVAVFNHLEVNNPLNQPDLENYQQLSQFENYGIKKFDVRAYAGLTFNVSPYLGFRMVINQGLIDRSNNEYYDTKKYNVHTDYTFSTIFRLNPKAIK